MRISELSRQTGVSVPTIKFYLREGLLPPGAPTARNQAEYDETHVTRVRLIRTLTGVGQLTLSSVREVLTAIDDRDMSTRGLCKAINQALFGQQNGATETVGMDVARAKVDDFIDDLGWLVDADAPGRQTVAQVLAALRRLGWDCDVDIFTPYADAARKLAIYERESMSAGNPCGLVARTVLLEVALAAMRRMAQEYYLGQRSGEPYSGEGVDPVDA